MIRYIINSRGSRDADALAPTAAVGDPTATPPTDLRAEVCLESGRHPCRMDDEGGRHAGRGGRSGNRHLHRRLRSPPRWLLCAGVAASPSSLRIRAIACEDSVVSTGAPLEFLGVNSARSGETFFPPMAIKWMKKGPSTPLRSGRDDGSFGHIGLPCRSDPEVSRLARRRGHA